MTDWQFSALDMQSLLVEETKASQKDDAKLEKFITHENRTLRFQNRLCVPNGEELKKKILDETHNTR